MTCKIRCLSGGAKENVHGPQQEENEGDIGESGSGEKANQAPRGAAHVSLEGERGTDACQRGGVAKTAT